MTAHSLLIDILRAKKISIPQLAILSGISHQTLYRLRNGSNIRQQTFQRLVNAYMKKEVFLK